MIAFNGAVCDIVPVKVKDYMIVLTKLKDDFQFHCRKCCLNCQTYKSNKRCRQYSQPRPLGLVEKFITI